MFLKHFIEGESIASAVREFNQLPQIKVKGQYLTLDFFAFAVPLCNLPLQFAFAICLCDLPLRFTFAIYLCDLPSRLITIVFWYSL